MTKSNTQAAALVRMVREAGRITRAKLQAALGIDDDAFEAAVAGAGRRVIRVRGQGGGFYPA